MRIVTRLNFHFLACVYIVMSDFWILLKDKTDQQLVLMLPTGLGDVRNTTLHAGYGLAVMFETAVSVLFNIDYIEPIIWWGDTIPTTSVC